MKISRRVLTRLPSMGLCRQTVSKLLKEYGITHRRHLTPADLDLFIQAIGTPNSVNKTTEVLSERV